MKMSYALVALVAMFCLAGFAAADDTTVAVGGSVSPTYSISLPVAPVNGVNFVPGTSTPFNIIVTGTTNEQLYVTASMAAPQLGFITPLNIPTPVTVSTWNAATGAYTATLAFTQVVLYTDTTGSHSGVVDITVSP